MVILRGSPPYITFGGGRPASTIKAFVCTAKSESTTTDKYIELDSFRLEIYAKLLSIDVVDS